MRAKTTRCGSLAGHRVCAEALTYIVLCRTLLLILPYCTMAFRAFRSDRARLHAQARQQDRLCILAGASADGSEEGGRLGLSTSMQNIPCVALGMEARRQTQTIRYEPL